MSPPARTREHVRHCQPDPTLCVARREFGSHPAQVLGTIAEVFGPVSAPFYAVRHASLGYSHQCSTLFAYARSCAVRRRPERLQNPTIALRTREHADSVCTA